MKRTFFGTILAVAACATLPAAVPSVTDVAMVQANDRLVTITYTLSNAPAVVTLDVQTNATANAAADDAGWTSIGGDGVWNAMGDVWKKVATGAHTITWRPDVSWPDHKIENDCARAVVTAWATNNTPAYMVVNLALDKTADGFLTFYPGEAYLPKSEPSQTKAITQNPEYKTNKLVMRKIMAAGVTWTMGSATTEPGRNSENEIAHQVTLADNYYIGVFPITQYQYYAAGGTSGGNYPHQNTPQFTVEASMRPVESIAGNAIRKRGFKTSPSNGTFLYALRDKTGILFDLPFETQWEFAARAGWGSGFWGNGRSIESSDANRALADLGRFGLTYSSDGTIAPADGGTPIVGRYEPNDWGLYDMFGCVRQACLDVYSEDNTELTEDQIDGGNSNKTRVARGGAWCDTWDKCRPAARSTYLDAPNASQMNSTDKGRVGFRVVCPVGIQ